MEMGKRFSLEHREHFVFVPSSSFLGRSKYFEILKKKSTDEITVKATVVCFILQKSTKYKEKSIVIRCSGVDTWRWAGQVLSLGRVMGMGFIPPHAH